MDDHEFDDHIHCSTYYSSAYGCYKTCLKRFPTEDNIRELAYKYYLKDKDSDHVENWLKAEKILLAEWILYFINCWEPIYHTHGYCHHEHSQKLDIDIEFGDYRHFDPYLNIYSDDSDGDDVNVFDCNYKFCNAQYSCGYICYKTCMKDFPTEYEIRELAYKYYLRNKNSDHVENWLKAEKILLTEWIFRFVDYWYSMYNIRHFCRLKHSHELNIEISDCYSADIQNYCFDPDLSDWW